MDEQYTSTYKAPRSPIDQHTNLPANFSEVLRPHDPSRLSLSTTDEDDDTPAEAAQHLDVRESLTALLDLASDPLDAKQLILVLSRDERGNDGLDEMLHSLMYVGGTDDPTWSVGGRMALGCVQVDTCGGRAVAAVAAIGGSKGLIYARLCMN